MPKSKNSGKRRRSGCGDGKDSPKTQTTISEVPLFAPVTRSERQKKERPSVEELTIHKLYQKCVTAMIDGVETKVRVREPRVYVRGGTVKAMRDNHGYLYEVDPPKKRIRSLI